MNCSAMPVDTAELDQMREQKAQVDAALAAEKGNVEALTAEVADLKVVRYILRLL